MARELGIHRKTLYRWLEDPAFVAIVDKMVESVDGLQADAFGLLVYRSSALMAEQLRLALEEVRTVGVTKKTPTLAATFRIFKNAVEAQKQAAALSLIGSARQGVRKPGVEVDDGTVPGRVRPETDGDREEDQIFDLEAWKKKALGEQNEE